MVTHVGQVRGGILAEQNLDACTLSLLLLQLSQADSLVDVAKLGADDGTQQDGLVDSMAVSLQTHRLASIQTTHEVADLCAIVFGLVRKLKNRKTLTIVKNTILNASD